MKYLLISLLMTLSLTARAAFVPSPPDFQAKSYALMDYASGNFLAEKNAAEHLPPASMTKVMTTYIVFEQLKEGNIHLNDQVLVSRQAWMPQDTVSKMFLRIGTHVSIRDLLQGLVVPSGNDAAVALAQYVAGSRRAFVQMMNETAKRLGLNNTHFSDVDGLPIADHYMSAHDLCVLARDLIQQFPEYYRLFSQKSFTYDHITQPNTNELLFQDPTVDGIKTGYTKAAGYCLLASAVRNGRRLISVVMGTPSENARARDNEQLLNYGFRFFETDGLLGPKSPAMSVRVYKGDTEEIPVGTRTVVYLGLPRGSHRYLKIVPNLDAPLIAPVKAGQPVGKATIMLHGKQLKTVTLTALRGDPSGGFLHDAMDQIRLWLND